MVGEIIRRDCVAERTCQPANGSPLRSEPAGQTHRWDWEQTAAWALKQQGQTCIHAHYAHTFRHKTHFFIHSYCLFIAGRPKQQHDETLHSPILIGLVFGPSSWIRGGLYTDGCPLWFNTMQLHKAQEGKESRFSFTCPKMFGCWVKALSRCSGLSPFVISDGSRLIHVRPLRCSVCMSGTCERRASGNLWPTRSATCCWCWAASTSVSRWPWRSSPAWGRTPPTATCGPPPPSAPDQSTASGPACAWSSPSSGQMRKGHVEPWGGGVSHCVHLRRMGSSYGGESQLVGGRRQFEGGRQGHSALLWGRPQQTWRGVAPVFIAWNEKVASVYLQSLLTSTLRTLKITSHRIQAGSAGSTDTKYKQLQLWLYCQSFLFLFKYTI